MTAGGVLAEAPRDASDAAPWELGGAETMNFAEEWMGRKAKMARRSSQSSALPAEREASSVKEGTSSSEAVEFSFGDAGVSDQSTSPLRASFEALSAARKRASAADWIEAATALKRDAVRVRNSRTRHSAVLLALADALTFTEPDDPCLDPEAGTVLDNGLALLGEPFLSEPAEERFLDDLLTKGWNLLPSASIEPLEA